MTPPTSIADVLDGVAPGPWKAEQLVRFAQSNERPWVGRLEERRYAALACGETQAEAIANARLIAAAPELLADLEFAVKLLSAFPLGRTAQVERMRNTVAKAKGVSASLAREEGVCL